MLAKNIWLVSMFTILLYGQTYAQTEHSIYIAYDTASINKQIGKAVGLEDVNTDSAIVAFEECLRLSKVSNHVNGLISSLKHLGMLYSNKGLYDQCLNAFTYARDACLGSKTMITALPVVYNGIANIYKMKGDYEGAARSYYRALLVADKLGIPTSGSVYNNMASVQVFLKQYPKAYYYLDKAEMLARKNDNKDLLASILANRGIVYKSERKFENALVDLKAALKLATDQGLSDARYNALTNIGQVYLAMGDAGLALKYLLQTQQIPGDINPYYQAVTLETIGVCYRDLHQLSQSEAFFIKALSIADDLGLQENRMSLNEKLAGIYATSGSFKKAYTYLAMNMSLRDSLQAKSVDQTISQLDVRYRTAEKEKDIISKQLMISQQENYLKKKNFWIWILSAGACLIAGLLIAIYRANKHKESLQAKQIHILEQQQRILQGGQQIGQLKAMMQGEEKERTRIAQELHDGIGGMLTAINMNLRALQKRHSNVPQMHELNEILSMLQDTAIEVRKTAHNLMPDILLNYSLPEALQLYCEHIDNNDKMQINLQFYGPLQELDKFLSLSLYRIIQELIQNIIKHANASVSELQLRYDGKNLTVTIEDNGVGFDKNVDTGGLGLQNVRSRIEALQGFISIESAEGVGTTIYMEVDVENLKIITDYENAHSNSR